MVFSTFCYVNIVYENFVIQAFVTVKIVIIIKNQFKVVYNCLIHINIVYRCMASVLYFIIMMNSKLKERKVAASIERKFSNVRSLTCIFVEVTCNVSCNHESLKRIATFHGYNTLGATTAELVPCYAFVFSIHFRESLLYT